MASRILSVHESQILRALEGSRESSLPDLAVDASLTPSVVREVVERLEAQDLVQAAGGVVRLTRKGLSLRNLVVHQQAFTWPEAEDIYAYASVDEQTVDAALDAAIAKLET